MKTTTPTTNSAAETQAAPTLCASPSPADASGSASAIPTLVSTPCAGTPLSGGAGNSGTASCDRRPNYRIYDRTGGGVRRDIHAFDLDDAIAQGREWIEEGDWSAESGDGGERVYRTITLDCCVREIVYAPDLSSLEALPAVYDVTIGHDGALVIEVDGGTLDTLIPALDAMVALTGQSTPAADGTVVLLARLRTPLPQIIDEDATDAGQSYDCSGTYSDTLPDCESPHSAEGTDSDGHCWVSTTEMGNDFGCSSHGGTAMSFYSVCKNCGQRKTESRPGSQRNSDEPLETITISDRDEASEEWLKRTHEQDGRIPEWLAELLGC